MRKIVFALSVVLTVMTACEDNNDSTINGNRSAVPFSQIQLSEKSAYEAGVPTVTTTQTYSYSQGQLTGFTIVQSYSVQGEPMCIENAASVTYSEHQAVVTDNFGNVSVYTLDDKGYATSCTRQENGTVRTYTFSYFTAPEGKYYLKNITESINDGVYASIDIDYGNYQALRILQKTGVPCLFLAELYPLSLHTAALYGKFLGEPFPILIDRIIPDGNKEVTNYIFSFDKRNLMTSCKEVINSYGTDYTRTVSYVIE